MDNKFNNTVERIIHFIDHLGISKREFAKKVGISHSLIGKSPSIGSDKMENILYTYPELSAKWLVSGVGAMLNDETENTFQEPREPYGSPKSNQESLVPLYNGEAWAGTLSLDFSKTEYIEDYIKVPFSKDGDVAIKASGMSMYPAIWPGDILIVRDVNHWREWLVYGKVYVISTDEQILVKVIRKGKVNPDNYFNIYSENEEYEDFELPKSVINKIMMVVGVVGRRDY